MRSVLGKAEAAGWDDAAAKWMVKVMRLDNDVGHGSDGVDDNGGNSGGSDSGAHRVDKEDRAELSRQLTHGRTQIL